MSLYIDHHLDVLASSPAEIQQIAERLDRPSAELGNCNPIWPPEQVAELFHWETVAKLDYDHDALNKARRFHISGTRTYGIVIDHVGEVSEAFPAAIFLLAYSDEMGGAAKFVFHAGVWMRELEEWNQHSPYPMEWALLDMGETCATVSREATPALSPGDFEAMAKRRFQNPGPERVGRFWYVRIWQDVFVDGVRTRQRQRVKLAPASTPEREAKKIAAEILRPVNQGLVTVGAAVNFSEYVEGTYKPTVMPLLAKSTQERSEGVIRNYLIPAFGNLCLRELTALVLQKYFSSMATSKLSHESRDKIRDVLSSILASAVTYGFLIKNPAEGLQLPPDKMSHRAKPMLSPEEFDRLVTLVAEPYATMLYVAVWTGLRVSELIGLRWRCVHSDSISIEERYCRGDWSQPKTKASAATIGVSPEVIARITRLKSLTVEVRAGRAVRKYKLVKSDALDDLVFQGVKDGHPMQDQNILKRHIKPAAEKLGLHVTWRCLRTSHATWSARILSCCVANSPSANHPITSVMTS
jgi:integrase